MGFVAPDADLMIDLHQELQRNPDPHGFRLRENLKRACDDYNGTNLSAAKVANAERSAREWLILSVRSRLERKPSHYNIGAFHRRLKQKELNSESDE